tara:strand:- start:2489 stop:3085 length:597 start_codon:yes stop_codon:yes gene_type:complete
MVIEKIPISEIQPYEKNAREHSGQQVIQIANSIKKFGFNNPLLIDENKGLIAGHGRLEAAKELGLTEAPCITLKHLDDKQKRAFILADNQLALNSSWNREMLVSELEHLKELDFDISTIGFSVDTLEVGEVDYSILDDEEIIQKTEELQGQTKRAIEFTFSLVDYPEAFKIISNAKEIDDNVGMVVVELLKRKYQIGV